MPLLEDVRLLKSDGQNPNKMANKLKDELWHSLYTSQLPEIPFYLVTSNPQLVRGNLGNWIIKRVGHGSHGTGDTRINRELVKSNSRGRLTVSLKYRKLRKVAGKVASVRW